MSYNILMFGWEFPPHNSGGLGVACAGIARALLRAGHRLHFVLPRSAEVSEEGVDFVFADNDRERFSATAITSDLYSPYKTSEHVTAAKEASKRAGVNYSGSLLEQVGQYALQGGDIALAVDHDVIHAHDWLSFPAAIEAKRASGKPFVAHVHATEIDRTGGNGVNEAVYEIERMGVQAADRVIAVSQFTKDTLVEHYGVSASKVAVAHNGIDAEVKVALPPVLEHIKNSGGKLVLFLGRITIQKGPDYFLEAAKKVCDLRDDAYFVMAGSGGMQSEMLERAAELGIAEKVFFPGFVRGQKIDQMYQSADLFVMSSISEPFGITPLEAMMNETPTLISKQSGVSEVVNHALTVDFWDTDRMADQINAVLEHAPLAGSLSENGHREVHEITWDETVAAITDVYGGLVD